MVRRVLSPQEKSLTMLLALPDVSMMSEEQENILYSTTLEEKAEKYKLWLLLSKF